MQEVQCTYIFFRRHSMNYKDWLNLWLNNYVKTSCKRRTCEMYSSTIERRIVPYLGNRDLNELTPELLQQFVINLRSSEGQALAANTVNGVITVVQSSLKMAHDLGYVPVYYGDKIRHPKTVEKKVECLTVLEQKKLENYIRNDKRYKLYGIIICMYTGLRIGELLALKWENVDMHKAQLTVESTCYYVDNKRVIDTPKTQHSLRTIPFPRQILPLFRVLKKHAKTEFVIEENGVPVSNRSLQRSFELIQKRLNIEHKCFHALRHTFATRALECGMDVKTLSELLGHKNPNVTLRRYAHSMLEHKKQMMNKLGRLFA